MNWADIVGLATSIVTAIGVIVAARQLTLSKRQTRTQFEDDLAREYRALVERMPVKALFGEVLEPAEYEEICTCSTVTLTYPTSKYFCDRKRD